MGFDMYLIGKIFLSPSNIYLRKIYWAIHDLFGIESSYSHFQNDSSCVKVDGVSFRLAYWRGAIPIHNWFMQECRDDISECYITEISLGCIKKLLNICETIMSTDSNWRDDIAYNLLPPLGYIIDDEVHSSYYDEIKYTIDRFKDTIELHNNENNLFRNMVLFYIRSW